MTGADSWTTTALCGSGSSGGSAKVYEYLAPYTGTYSIQVTAASPGGSYVDYYWKLASGGCASSGWTCISRVSATGNYGSMSWTAGTLYYILLDGESSVPSYNHTFYIKCPYFDSQPIDFAVCAGVANVAQYAVTVVGLSTYQWQRGIPGVGWANITAATTPNDGCTYSGYNTATLTVTNAPITMNGYKYRCLAGGSLYSDPANLSVENCDVFLHPTVGEAGSHCGTCMQIIDAGGKYYDDGGPSANYSNNIGTNDGHSHPIYRTFCPASDQKAVKAHVNTISMYNSSDFLNVYNSATLANIMTPNNPANGTDYISTDPSGCLTFAFYSDASNTAAGWYIDLSTVLSSTTQTTTNSDCENATTLCSNATITDASYGPGMRSTCIGCVIYESYSSWYKFKITSGNKLAFTITPIVGTDDMDFALYKVTTDSIDACGQIGSAGNPQRCSYYSGTGATGMRDGAGYETQSSDVSETVLGSGAKNGFVYPLTVAVGDRYVLMVNKWTASAGGFTIDFGAGNVVFDCGFIFLPIELLSFNAACIDDKVKINWSTASETNNHYFTIERSKDAVTWEAVTTIPGAGTSNSTLAYSYTDNNPYTGTSYYRLRQTDFNGKSQTFNPVVVSCSEESLIDFNIVTIKTNEPNNNELSIIYTSPTDGEKITAGLYNVLGQRLIQQGQISSEGNNTIKFSNYNFSRGVYLIKLDNTEKVIIRKIIIP